MTPPRPGHASSLEVPDGLSSEELSALENNLRFEFGSHVVQTNELRTMLALVDKDIEYHNSEIARLDTQRAQLLSLLSPMRKMPAETLLLIFQDACETNNLKCYPWGLEGEFENCGPAIEMTSPVIRDLPAMAISSVCSRWRNLALSSPSLWANIRVETYTTSLDEDELFETFAGFIGTVTRYLEISGDWPLRLVLGIVGPTEYKEIPSLICLAEHAWRWKTFTFEGYSLIDYDILSELRFPLLSIIEDVTVPDLDCFNDCPRLRALSTFWPDQQTEIVYSRLAQLDHLGTGPQTLSELAGTLRSCPSLESLELGYIAPGPEDMVSR